LKSNLNSIDSRNRILLENNLNKKEISNNQNQINHNNKWKTHNNKNNIIQNILSKYKFNDYELNSMTYKEALIYDTRTCCEYYKSLIKTKQPLLFAFCSFNDFNSRIIKTCIFGLSFAIYYAINFEFITEDTIHLLYENGGKYNIFDFIPTICISFGIAHVITIIIKLVFLSERNLKELKMQPTFMAANRISYKVKKNLVCKYFFYFILSLLFLFLFWLLLSGFGAVYQNTQRILLMNTLISFGISFIYPFFYNVIPCMFRCCSLRKKQGGIACIYNINKLFQLL